MIPKVVLFDDASWRDELLPLVATRPVSALRVGIVTIAEKWSLMLQQEIVYHTAQHLRRAYPALEANQDRLIVRGGLIPEEGLIAALTSLRVGQALYAASGEWLACYAPSTLLFNEMTPSTLERIIFQRAVSIIRFPEDVFLLNGREIENDIIRLGLEKNESSSVLFGERLYTVGTPHLRRVSISTASGPVYIGPNAVIEEGVFIKGPVSIGEGARVKTGARIYPNVTVGPGSTVCGELNNTVIWGNSAKGHEGYLGCAVIGEGCNIGAGTSNSNLRNDWKTVSLYDYAQAKWRNTEQLKCGVIMGDYGMLGIQSIITTGTVLGVGVQIATSTIIPRFVPDFIWLTEKKIEPYRIDQFLGFLRRMNEVKNTAIEPSNSRIFEFYYAMTEEIRRKWLDTLR